MGDFNITPRSLPAYCTMVDEHGWQDAGMVHQWCAQGIDHPTCKANNAEVATRRDIIMVSPLLALSYRGWCWHKPSCGNSGFRCLKRSLIGVGAGTSQVVGTAISGFWDALL